ncbi:MAG: hypothetical protein ABFC63_12025 [Thermoguttaceae bacterium]
MSKRSRRRRPEPPPASVCGLSRPDAAPVSHEPLARRVLTVWWGPVAIASAALAMLAWTWGTWPDVLIDFGVERYIPWRLAQGDVLYRDIAFHNGPFSQYFNALCFGLFGSSLRTLVFSNLVWLALLICLLHYALRQVGSRTAATIACLVFVLLFAFGQYLGIGNYNYVCPYAHEMTHGLTLSLAAVVAAWPADRRQRSRMALGGLALGIAFLTKTEVFLPGAFATATAVALSLWFQRPGWRPTIARVGCFLIAFLVPPTIAFVCLATAMPTAQAMLGTLGTGAVALHRDILDLPFYRRGIGLDQPMHNAWLMLSLTGLEAIILAPAAALGLLLRRPQRFRRVIVAAVFFAMGAILWCLQTHIPWYDMARPLPILMLAMAAAVVASFVRGPRKRADQFRLVRQVSLLVFAMVLLTKIALYARIYHYGFILAMPAVLLLCVAAFDWIPRFLDRRGGFGPVFAAAAAALLSVTIVAHLDVQSQLISAKTCRVGAGADAFWAYAAGDLVNTITAEIAKRTPPAKTLAVFPEGVMINCLTRLRNPTPYIHLMPTELILFGEQRIQAAYQAHPPDLIVFAHKDTSEFGLRFFGQNYGQRLADWVLANYRPVALAGSLPFQNDQFGILLLEKKDGPATEEDAPRRSDMRNGGQ